MRITFLGTGTSQGIPVIGCGCEVCTSADPRDRRLRSSLLVERGDTVLTIDCGPDFRQQMLREKVTRLDAVLFTHEHMDHVAGLDEVRAFNFRQEMFMPLYASERVEERLRQQFSYAFLADPYPGSPRLEFRRLPEEPFRVGDLEVVPVPAFHGNWPVTGFRLGPVTYLTDANRLPETSKALIRGSEVFIVNALHRRPHHSHFHLDAALELIEELGCPQNYLIHMSHHMGLHAAVDRLLPEGVSLAWDGLSLEFQ